MKKQHPKIGKLIKVCPAGQHAWYESEFGPVRKSYYQPPKRIEPGTKDFTHLIYCPFSGLGLHNGFRGDEWFQYRIDLWKKYTLQSLKNQKNQNFIYWMSFRPQEITNPLTQQIPDALKECKFKAILSFDGCMFWDDKYPEDDLLGRLKRTLPDLTKIVEDKPYVYMTILASDDMYHEDAIDDIQKELFRLKGSLNHAKGYVYSYKTKKLAIWQPPFPERNPPFDTLMFPTEIFLDADKHYNYSGPYKDHWQVTKIFDYKRMADGHFCVGVHEQNISTHWRVIEMRNWKAILRMVLTPYNWKRLFLRLTGRLYWVNLVQKHSYIGDEINNKKDKKDILSKFGIK